VVLYHFQDTLYEAWPDLTVFRPVLNLGFSGVPLFFILSGFIIWHNYGTRSTLTPRATASFLWRRFARLWPVNVLTQAMAIPILWVAVHHFHNFGAPVPAWYSATGWLQSAFMVQEARRPEVTFTWNQPSWSLTAEMAAYVVFPLLLAALLAGRRSRLRPNHAAWFVLALLLAYEAETRLTILYAYSWLAQLIVLFVCGVFLRLAGPPTRRAVPFVVAAQVAAPALVVVACYTKDTWYIGALLAIWVYSLSIDRGPGVWFFSTRASRTAGNSSYSLYMLHWAVFAAGGLLLIEIPTIKSSYLQLYTVVCLIVIAGGSWTMWRFFETPSRRRLNRLFERVWRPAPSVAQGRAGALTTRHSMSDEPLTTVEHATIKFVPPLP
jgi:peptidoglycan/LPS O-acetylase OafA/YrhL